MQKDVKWIIIIIFRVYWNYRVTDWFIVIACWLHHSEMHKCINNDVQAPSKSDSKMYVSDVGADALHYPHPRKKNKRAEC